MFFMFRIGKTIIRKKEYRCDVIPSWWLTEPGSENERDIVSEQIGHSYHSGSKLVIVTTAEWNKKAFSISQNACWGKILSFGGNFCESLSVRTGWANFRAKNVSYLQITDYFVIWLYTIYIAILRGFMTFLIVYRRSECQMPVKKA